MYDIITDMSLDIAPETVEKYDIKFIPMEVVLGEDRFIVSRPSDFDEMHIYYEKLRRRVPTQTGQVTPYNYVEAFEPYVRKGKEVLCITLSSGLSKTYENALLAVDQLKDKYGEHVNIEVLDSLGGTGGMGMLCHMAGVFRNQGLNLKENVEKLKVLATRICYWFKVQDLMYLANGGRISGTSAVLGTALNIKPVLNIQPDGTLKTIAKKRGNKMAFKYMLECYSNTRVRDDEVDREDIYPDETRNLVYISNSDCMEDANTLKSMILAENPAVKVVITSVCHVIGAHVGPDMIAVIHFGRPGARVI